MSWLLLALVTSAPCEHPGLSMLPEARQQAACALLAEPAPTALNRSTLGEIYARPGFERARQRNTGTLQAMYAQLMAWLESWFESTGAEAYSNATRVFVLLLALAVGAAATWRFLSRRRKREVAGVQHTVVSSLQLDDPLAHLGRAEALLSTAPREAIREGLLALLSSLERRRFARPDRVKTNRELCQELSARGAPAQLIARVAPLFDWYDAAFYSLEAVRPDEALRFLGDVRGIQEGGP